MMLHRRLTEARAAQARAAQARERLTVSVRHIESQVYARPLACVGMAAGSGWALGRLSVHPWQNVSMAYRTASQAWPWVAQLLALARDRP